MKTTKAAFYCEMYCVVYTKKERFLFRLQLNTHHVIITRFGDMRTPGGCGDIIHALLVVTYYIASVTFRENLAMH